MTLTAEILTVGGIVCLIIVSISIIRAILHERKIRNSPIVSTKAVVVDKIYHESGSEESVLHRSWSIEFKIDDSVTKRFSVGKERYPSIQKGEKGTLTYQYTRFIDFRTRD